MAKLVAWLPQLTDSLSWGCTTSVLLKNLENDVDLRAAREICLDLWPFVQELPDNIAAIKSRLPDHMEAAASLFGDLADEERYYQQLFLKQCTLVGISGENLHSYAASPASTNLKSLLSYQSTIGRYDDGLMVLAIAELAATAFCRACLPHFETYFVKHAESFQQHQIEEGLEWLRVHARQQTRNALLLLKTLGELEDASQKNLPPVAANTLNALLDLWQCPPRKLLGLEKHNIQSQLKRA